MRTRSVIPDEIVGGSGSAEIILTKLRGMIAGGRQETDTILGTIAVAANALTGASGAAIAMPRDGAVVCVGRSGDIAPELGDLLNIDSGISGECLRTGTSMRCDDASRDFHVNAEVCRQMGLQSIAVVPLRGRHGRVGVLEAFSAQSYAFTEEHMDLLGRLAGLAEAAWAQAPETQGLGTPLLGETSGTTEEPVAEEDLQAQPLPADSPSPSAPIETRALAGKSRLAGAVAAMNRVGAAIATGLHDDLQTDQRWRYGTIAGLATILLLLLAVLSWKVWYKASLPISSTPSTGTRQEAAPSPDAAGTEQALSFPSSSPNASISPPPTSALEATKAPIAIEPIRRKVLVPGADRSHSNFKTDAVDAPQVPTSDAGPTDLENLLSASPALPRLGIPISQGVSGGVLVQKVLPAYPSQARQAHVQGTVVLEATVNERGEIEDLKVVSGPPLLAQSAMDAVRKWRYTPYLLNGKPVKKETQINITFIPQ